MRKDNMTTIAFEKKPSTAEWQLCSSQKKSQATAQEALKEPRTTFNL